MSAGVTGTEHGVVGVYPDGGRSIWLLCMLITFKAVGEDTGGEYSVFEQTVPPRAGVPPHTHHQESEAFYVLEGEFDLLTGGQAMRAGVGEFVLVPKGVVHSFTNPGTMPTRFPAIVTPGGCTRSTFRSRANRRRPRRCRRPPRARRTSRGSGR